MAKRSKRPSKPKAPQVGPCYILSKPSGRAKQAGGFHKRGQAASKVCTVPLDDMALSETLARIAGKAMPAFQIES